MPGDATHVKWAKWASFFGAIGLYTIGWDIIHIIATVTLFMFSVMWLSPDLDLPGTAPLKRWGGLQVAWAMFEKKIPHRSRWSHGWILGFILIQVNFLVIVAVIIAFLRVCWLPLIEPLITQGNAVIDDLLVLHFSPAVIAGITWGLCVCLAAHWHHKILDTFMRN